MLLEPSCPYSRAMAAELLIAEFEMEQCNRCRQAGFKASALRNANHVHIGRELAFDARSFRELLQLSHA